MQLENKFSELHTYIDKVKEELRIELKLPSLPTSTIGISFDPSICLLTQPHFSLVVPKLYRVKNTNTWFEVIKQDSMSGLLTLSDSNEMLSVISPGLFCILFETE